MKKIYIECDGCGREIKGDSYYFIDIYQKVNKDGKLTTYGAAKNIANNLNKAYGKETTYCEDCVYKIDEFIDELNCIK